MCKSDCIEDQINFKAFKEKDEMGFPYRDMGNKNK